MSDSREARVAAVREHLAGTSVIEDTSAAGWPFHRHITPSRRAPAVWVRDLHLAFPAGQISGTRLVLTQSTYHLQRLLDWLETAPEVQLVADASRSALERAAPEAFAARGPWFHIDLHEIAAAAAGDEPRPDGGLHAAFTQPNPERRLDACRLAAEASPDNPAVQLALASVCMELQQLDDARAALALAVSLVPDWEAAHFELGKLCLRAEDTEGAAAAFAAAAERMPTFAAALSNLGAALGELDRADEALDALLRAQRLDPRSHTVLNNIGALHREQGRLAEAAAAFREVIALAPAFVFGYYNLGHTLFLEGDFAGARRAYEEGFARDAQKNARQTCRLGVVRAAAGDADAAIELLRRLGEELPPERGRDLFEEAESTLSALSAMPGVDAAAIARVRAAIRPYSS